MGKLLDGLANLAGLIGIVACAIAGIVRLTGGYYVVGYEALTVFIVGIAFMVVACLAKLEAMRLAMGVR